MEQKQISKSSVYTSGPLQTLIKGKWKFIRLTNFMRNKERTLETTVIAKTRRIYRLIKHKHMPLLNYNLPLCRQATFCNELLLLYKCWWMSFHRWLFQSTCRGLLQVSQSWIPLSGPLFTNQRWWIKPSSLIDHLLRANNRTAVNI